MTEIDLNGKSERDLLVIIVVTVNAMTEKLNNVCHEYDRQNLQLAILQKEHDERKDNAGCASPPTSRKKMFTTGGVGGIIGGALATAVVMLWEFFSRK
jgi:hypothetical protein